MREKKPIQVLRARQGGIPKDRLAKNKEQKLLIERLKGALGNGPRTVPEVAAETGVESGEVLWYLMALKKFGEVVEAEERGDYFAYALKEDPA